MSMKLTAMAMDLRVGNPLRKLVLLKLCDNANDKGECFPSVQYIADQCEISRRSVVNHINALIELGFLVRRSRYQKAEQITNFYVIDLSGKTRIVRTDGADQSDDQTHLDGVQEMHAPRAGDALPRAGDALPPRAGDAHGTSHSFEPVIEPVIPQSTYQDSAQGCGDRVVQGEGLRDLFSGAGVAVAGKSQYPVWFAELWEKYPPRQGASDKRRALHAAKARLAEGKTPDFLLEAVDRYARFIRATGRWGSQYVMQAQTFFGPGGHIDNPWSVNHDFNRTNSVSRESLIERIERQAREVCADAEASAHGGGVVDPDDADFRASMGGAAGRR